MNSVELTPAVKKKLAGLTEKLNTSHTALVVFEALGEICKVLPNNYDLGTFIRDYIQTGNYDG